MTDELDIAIAKLADQLIGIRLQLEEEKESICILQTSIRELDKRVQSLEIEVGTFKRIMGIVALVVPAFVTFSLSHFAS